MWRPPSASCPGCVAPVAVTRATPAQREQIRLVTDAYAEVLGRLTELRPALEEVARQLYDAKELEGYQVAAIHRAHTKRR